MSYGAAWVAGWKLDEDDGDKTIREIE